MKQLFTLILAGVFFVSGCGAGGESRTIKVTMGPGMSFDPPKLEAKAGERLTIELTNADVEEHDFVVRALGQKLILKPGASGQVKLAPKKPGEYEIECSLPGHKDAGMVGTLLVVQ